MADKSLPPDDEEAAPRARMSGSQRREQLIGVGRKLFAKKGYEAVSVEEIASEAKVSKPTIIKNESEKPTKNAKTVLMV